MAARSELPAGTAAELPSVDRLLGWPELSPLLAAHGREAVVAVIREHLAELRADAVAGKLDRERLENVVLTTAISKRAAAAARPRLTTVFNLTGTVLHTNLGRALLPEAAVEAIVAAARAPVDLEFDLPRGARGDRDRRVASLLAELTGAEAAAIVNNNAAAVVLALHTLARGREVVVSRGELIEIGGSFRLPDMMRAAGARLVEVGTTNRTHPRDYEQALSARTAMILKVHPSNYVVSGFTSAVELPALAELARAQEIPLVVDLGSGALLDLASFGLPKEPVVRAALEAGADLVLFSGDKLLGGPQAGLVVGRDSLLRRLNRNPLKRALRVGKLTLAGLEAVLRLYRNPERLAAQLPTLRILTRPLSAIRAQAERLVAPLAQALGPAWRVAAEPLDSQIGSGAQPGAVLPSYGLAVRRASGVRGKNLDRLARSLRDLPRPVIGRIADETLWLDVRCLADADEPALLAELSRLSP